MVNATIDNSPVSIQLLEGETTTVPSNETWKVTISAYAVGFNGQGPHIIINGKTVHGIFGNDDNDARASTSVNYVLAGGDVIELGGFDTFSSGLAIQGFVVDS